MKQKKQSWWDKLTPEEKEKKIRESNEKKKRTCLEKYGVENPSQAEEIKEKKKNIFLRRYGVENPNQIKKIQEKKKRTCLEKYGVENPSQTGEVKEKKKRTCLEKYGVEHPTQVKEIKEKMERTLLKKYGVKRPAQNKLIMNKMKQTCFKKYGTENPLQNPKVREKIKQTCLEKYGVGSPLEIKNTIEKTQKIKKEKTYSNLFNSRQFKNKIIPLFTLEEYIGQKDIHNIIHYKFQCKKCGKVFEDTLANGKIPRCFNCYPVENRFTIPHKIICEYLEKENIIFEIEKYISPYFVDIFISPNKVIEVYGDYWHGNPEIYKEDEMIKFPSGNVPIKEKWQIDAKRIQYLKERGNEILIIWENEINKNLDDVKIKIIHHLSKFNYNDRKQ